MNSVLGEGNDGRILDSLRPIFPQLNDHILKNCIRNVERTVGSDPATIIPGCIDLLLAGTAVEPLDHAVAREVVTISNSQDDDIICLSGSNSPRKVVGPFVINDELPPSLDLNASPLKLSGNSLTPSSSGPLPNVFTNVFGIERTPRSGSERNLLAESESRTPSSTVTTSSTPEPVHSQVTLPQGSLEMRPSSPVGPMDEALKEIQTLFPDVADKYVHKLIKKWPDIPMHMAINNACNELLETSNYPKREVFNSRSTCSTEEKSYYKDYWKDHSSMVSPDYKEHCLHLLQNEFRFVPMKDIRDTLRRFNDHYAPSKRYLEETFLVSSSPGNSSSTFVSASSCTNTEQSAVTSTPSTPNNHGSSPFSCTRRLLKFGRQLVKIPSFMDFELRKEVDFVRQFERTKCEEKDRLVALSLNDRQYEEEGQKIECGCCYGDAAFEDMVQCLEGHLFCASCLMNYAKEAAFGQGKAALTCMSGDCDGTFPLSQLQKALPRNVLEKYEDRVQEESLQLAQMDDLVRCPSCDFAAIMPPEDKVFKCQNPSCAKETCRYCKEDWAEHFGLKCKEVEKSAQKDVRLSYEERMTMAKIRKCAKCGCEFTKSDGCNKMTCRCGAKMCYVCRKPGISYNHFCQHPKDPGKSCAKCKSCSLWTDPSEDDNRAVKELEKEANEAKRKLDAETDVTDNNPTKKRKAS